MGKFLESAFNRILVLGVALKLAILVLAISYVDGATGSVVEPFEELGKIKSSLLEKLRNDNTVAGYKHKHVDCGTIVTNITHILVKNPHYPSPTFTKTICETVVERANPSITKLKVYLKQLELYRPTIDGQCNHDRFSIYTDLNAPLTPIVCGNHTGKTISIPFVQPQTSLIVSITTSDLDHDRNWAVEVEQEI